MDEVPVRQPITSTAENTGLLQRIWIRFLIRLRQAAQTGEDTAVLQALTPDGSRDAAAIADQVLEQVRAEIPAQSFDQEAVVQEVLSRVSVDVGAQLSQRIDNIESALVHQPVQLPPYDDTELRTLMALQIGQQAPSQDLPIGLNGVCIEHTHLDRISKGTVDLSGFDLNWVAGDLFAYDAATNTSTWDGGVIWVNSQRLTIAKVTSPTHITLAVTFVGAVAVPYVFSICPSINYPDGSLCSESDRKVIYCARTATGTCSYNGTNVYLTSGIPFDRYWTSIRIGSTVHRVALVQSDNWLQLFDTVGVGFDFWSVDSGAWFYQAGVYLDLRTKMPHDLAIVDTSYRFASLDTGHTHYWTGIAMIFAPGDEEPGQVCAFPLRVPSVYYWVPCDGTAIALSRPDGTLDSPIATPIMDGEIVIQGGGYTGIRKPASKPKWGPSPPGAATDDATLTVGSNTFKYDVAGSPAVVSISDHHHLLSDGMANIQAPSEAAGGMPLRMVVPFYMRK